MNRANHDFAALAERFAIRGDFVEAVPYGSGHINDTYAMTVSQAGRPVRYLLQRINDRIFTNVPALMSNISQVCRQAHRSLARQGAPDASRRALTLIPTVEGDPFETDPDGHHWRMYLFIEGATGHDIVQNPEQAFAAARAFGQFQKLLADLPIDGIHETIPDFHHTPKRFQAFEQALAQDPHNRAAKARPEIDWLLAHRELASALLDKHHEGSIPLRVTHNDTKLNNVLIDDATDEAICVIDLDTVMPGLALYDFGDLVRTSTSPVAEDEPDPGKVTMRMNMFEALTRGYLDGAGDFLNSAEVQSLPLAGMVITLTIGIRFTTDYLLGDVYFKTKREDHNLQRARTQFALVDSMEAQQAEMQACVREASR